NPKSVLKVGVQANARIRLAQRSVLAVPSVALTNNNGDYAVWLLRDGKVKRQPVRIGQRDDARGLSEVIQPDGTQAALQPGDVVLAGRYDGLKDGQEVRVVQSKAAPPTPTASAAKA
ncbi:MAG: hypothetical protein KGQ77_05515, partial [Betaproteobacteria bacterium]|nr:hypothetical protein [Betaproteobacteria bacterium]